MLKLNRNDNTPLLSSHPTFAAVDFLIENSISSTSPQKNFHFFFFFFFSKISSRIDCKQINLPLTSISTTEITIEQTRCFSMHNQYRCNFRFFTFQQTFNQLFNPFNPHSFFFFFSQIFKPYSRPQFSHPFYKNHRIRLSVQFIVSSIPSNNKLIITRQTISLKINSKNIRSIWIFLLLFFQIFHTQPPND